MAQEEHKKVVSCMKRKRIAAMAVFFGAVICISFVLLVLQWNGKKSEDTMRDITDGQGYESLSTFYGSGKLTGLDQYVNQVSQTVVDQGITIELKEAVLDENKLIVTFLIQLENDLEDDEILSPSIVGTLDEQDCFEDGCGISKPIKVAENTYQIYIESEVNGLYEEGKAKIYLYIDQLFIGEDEVDGDWDFEFTLDAQSLVEDTTTIPVNTTVQLTNGDSFEIEELQYNALETVIHTQMTNADGGVYLIAGEDANGNTICFMPQYSTEGDLSCTFSMYDPEDLLYETIEEDSPVLKVAVYLVQSGNNISEGISEEYRVSDFVTITKND